MAVRPYLSRSEVWLASGNFRIAFKFPIDFHPSAFIKWYPGHMAKGLFPKCIQKLGINHAIKSVALALPLLPSNSPAKRECDICCFLISTTGYLWLNVLLGPADMSNHVCKLSNSRFSLCYRKSSVSAAICEHAD